MRKEKVSEKSNSQIMFYFFYIYFIIHFVVSSSRKAKI